VVFPMHPRTRARMNDLGFSGNPAAGFRIVEPLPYLEFLALQRDATVVITDSGGIQEETTFLGVPCLTVRENTERPITVSMGTNRLVGRDLSRLVAEIRSVLAGNRRLAAPIPLWDGHAAERIARVIQQL